MRRRREEEGKRGRGKGEEEEGEEAEEREGEGRCSWLDKSERKREEGWGGRGGVDTVWRGGRWTGREG